MATIDGYYVPTTDKTSDDGEKSDEDMKIGRKSAHKISLGIPFKWD